MRPATTLTSTSSSLGCPHARLLSSSAARRVTPLQPPRRRGAAPTALSTRRRLTLWQQVGQQAAPRQQAGEQPQQPQQQQQQELQEQPAQGEQPWLLRRVDTLAALLERATPQAQQGAGAGPQQQQPQEEEQEEPYVGPKLRYGVPVSSWRELQAAVLAHWERTAGDRVPGSDHNESLGVEGLAEVAVVSRAGREYDDWKLVNQDAHLVLPLPSPAALAAAADSDGEAALRGPASSLLLGAFDGHGHMGTAASRYTRQFIATGVLNSRWHQLDDPGASLDGSSASLDSGAGSSAEGGFGGSSPQPAPGTAEGAQQALASAFEYAGRAMGESGLELRESGSTAVVCLVEPGRVTAAWCGDSRAVIGLHVPRPSGPACLVHSLTADHRPDRPLERQRIEAAGGQVLQVGRDGAGNPAGPFRLCGTSPLMTPRPMVSRAFGDTNSVPWGLTHTPDIVSIEFPARPADSGTASAAAASASASSAAGAGDSNSSSSASASGRHVLILGTDGFWDTTTPADACVAALGQPTALAAAQALVDAALRRWAVETQGIRVDDITVLVAYI